MKITHMKSVVLPIRK